MRGIHFIPRLLLLRISKGMRYVFLIEVLKSDENRMLHLEGEILYIFYTSISVSMDENREGMIACYPRVHDYKRFPRESCSGFLCTNEVFCTPRFHQAYSAGVRLYRGLPCTDHRPATTPSLTNRSFHNACVILFPLSRRRGRESFAHVSHCRSLLKYRLIESGPK